MSIKLKALLLFLLVSSRLSSEKSDLVVFSFDRPLQLYALLESAHLHMTGLEHIYVIYRTSDEKYQTAYEEVKKTFQGVTYLMQGEHPDKDFKLLTMHATFDSSSDYILFAVDDIIVKDAVDVSQDIDLMVRTGAYGMFYRLGTHLTRCYTKDCSQAVPSLSNVQKDIYSWKFQRGEHDWGYPHTVDMTLYRKKDLMNDFQTIEFSNPNYLEGAWASRSYKVLHRTGLCYEESKIVNLPLNRVQNTALNLNMEIPKELLLELFNKGKKIDIFYVYHIQNKSAHWPIYPVFIDR